MTKEELVKIYNETEEYSDSMRALEYDYILENMQEFFEDYTTNFSDYSSLFSTFDLFVHFQISEWQVENGFVTEDMMDFEIEDFFDEDD